MHLKKKSILFLTPYPAGEAPSQRFRFEQYLPLLAAENFNYRTESFLTLAAWHDLYRKGNVLMKVFSVISGYLKRWAVLLAVPTYDFVFIHREAAPAGPPVFEWIIAKVLRKKIIYDFDDAIWLTDKNKESLIFRLIRWRSKVASICKWSYKVSCGNEYLCAYARQFNDQVVYNPTTIDTEKLHNLELYHVVKNSNKIVIGWTGSHSTLKYLKSMESGLTELSKKYPNLELLVIADQFPQLDFKNIKFIPWSHTTEITGLLESDIGIMPLPDDMWAQGKCGFKALQYMALQLPAIASPIGVNTRIIDEGQNGFLCSTSQEWIAAIEKLIADKNLRDEMGKKGRTKVVNEFSVNSNKQNFLNLFS